MLFLNVNLDITSHVLHILQKKTRGLLEERSLRIHMKAVQIERYSKNIHTVLSEIPIPETGSDDVLIKVKAAAVNPLDILIATGRVRLIQDYKLPITLGNECAGVVEKTGRNATQFQPGDNVYTRLPLEKIGAFAEAVCVNQNAVAKMPEGYDFDTAAAIPLTGLTAWQGLTEELKTENGRTLFISGGS